MNQIESADPHHDIEFHAFARRTFTKLHELLASTCRIFDNKPWRIKFWECMDEAQDE
jgi:hypothetical protein